MADMVAGTLRAFDPLRPAPYHRPKADAAAGLLKDTSRMLGERMGVTYFKRYRMEYDLDGELFPVPELPPGYSLVPWRPTLLDAHVDAKYRSFRFEIDANVFTCFHARGGCSRLMQEFVRRAGFLTAGPWVLRQLRPV